MATPLQRDGIKVLRRSMRRMNTIGSANHGLGNCLRGMERTLVMGTIFNIWLIQWVIGIALGTFTVITTTTAQIIKFDKEWKIEHNKHIERIEIK